MVLLSQHGFIPLHYNSGDQNVLIINNWYACLHVLSRQLTVWNAYLSLLGYNIVVAEARPEPTVYWESLTSLKFDEFSLSGF